MAKKKNSFVSTVVRLARNPHVQRIAMSAIPLLIGLLRSRKSRTKKK